MTEIKYFSMIVYLISTLEFILIHLVQIKWNIYRLKLCPLNLQQCGRTLLVSQHQHIGSGNGDIKGPPDTT